MEVTKFQAVILPYRLDASMYIFLPAKGSSLSELEQTLTTTNWQEWLLQFNYRDGVLGLPKFKIETRVDAFTQLQALGCKRIFRQFAALRPAVTIPEGARLTDALQKTEINVNEKETEVVSEGVMGGIPGGIASGVPAQERPKPFLMLVNRPFFFAIRHKQTGQLLFLGAVAEP
jgi:serpin B